MGKRLATCRVTLGLLMGTSLLAILPLVCWPAAAQDAAPAAKGPCDGCSVDGKTTPRMPDGDPDLNGFYNNLAINAQQQFERAKDGSILFDFSTGFNNPDVCTTDACQDPNQPAYKPEYMAKVKEIAATMYEGTSSLDPQNDCKPLGIPRTGIGSIQIVQTPQVVAILYEGAPNSIYRIIYTDGRPHPADLDTSYMGDSIGHWDGDTLVVDVTGLSDETWLNGGVGAPRDKYTSIHSDQEHVIERWTRDGDVLTYEATVEDPVMFTKPWVITPRKVRHAGPAVNSNTAILEDVCQPREEKTHMVKPTNEDKGGCSYRCTTGTGDKISK